MARSRVAEIIRHFRENGLKLLLEHPANARELMTLTATRLHDRMDFARMTVDPTSYIAADYRHLASDLVLRVPFRVASGRRTLTLFILIEHQSEPDPLIGLRVVDYVVQIYKRQARNWLAGQRSLKGFLFDPVLPVVLYTGLSSWPALPRVAELVKEGQEFVALIPDLDPLYVNLPEVAPAMLEGAGPLGWVLELIQQRQARPQEFRALVVRVVRRLEEMPARERLRWLELLSYIRALVYHDREPSEQDELREVIAGSVRTDEHRREVEDMFRSGADVLIEQGRQEGAVRALQRALVNLLRTKFDRLPRATEKVIRTTQDLGQLNAWLVRAGTASTLAEIEFGPGAPPSSGGARGSK
jgi:Putative transposase, YhgA-like